MAIRLKAVFIQTYRAKTLLGACADKPVLATEVFIPESESEENTCDLLQREDDLDFEDEVME